MSKKFSIQSFKIFRGVFFWIWEVVYLWKNSQNPYILINFSFPPYEFLWMNHFACGYVCIVQFFGEFKFFWRKFFGNFWEIFVKFFWKIFHISEKIEKNFRKNQKNFWKLNFFKKIFLNKNPKNFQNYTLKINFSINKLLLKWL